MLHQTLYSEGKNNFKDYEFSPKEWSAPTMVSPVEIIDRIDSFSLCGRRIKHIRFIGHSFYHTREWVEEAAYNCLDSLPEEERQRLSNYGNITPDMQYVRAAQIDEPIIIEFEDGDRFEIDTPQASEFRMSLNCIPRSIESKYGVPNIQASILFAPCIGQLISEVKVNTYSARKDPMFASAFEEPPYERELVSEVELILEDRSRILIGPYIDFCSVDYLDHNKNAITIPFSDLKTALVNWEDLHVDESIDFRAESHTLFFGEKGAEYAEAPYLTLVAAEADDKHSIYIGVDDFTLIAWCVSRITGCFFDEYEDYSLKKSDWVSILKEAQSLLATASFDELFDKVVGWNIKYSNGSNYMLSELNSSGAGFWKNREKYRKQIDDLIRWTALAIKENGKLEIYGY